jgi:GMP synthase (glutamine-hydrolysing)
MTRRNATGTKHALAIRHVAFEDLAALRPVLERHGYVVHYVDAGTDSLRSDQTDKVDLLIVLGGPIGASDEILYPFLTDELALIHRAIALDLPVLGICLGAQLIARALGSNVYPAPAREIGWSNLMLTEEGRRSALSSLEGLPVLHWHGDTFDLPAGAQRLASTELCINQAFSLGPNILALQFHMEVGGSYFERWLIGHAHEIAATPGVTAPCLRKQAQQFAKHAATQGQRCLQEWLEGVIN